MLAQRRTIDSDGQLCVLFLKLCLFEGAGMCASHTCQRISSNVGDGEVSRYHGDFKKCDAACHVLKNKLFAVCVNFPIVKCGVHTAPPA